ncbi:MAG: hypothetical protein M3R08_08300 [Bacteroidota bacterium]|nr:hypothetical protein [Bacteroidota bacterium]
MGQGKANAYPEDHEAIEVPPDLHSSLNTEAKLTLIKSLHTLVWVFLNVVIFYFLYTLIFDRIGLWTWLCLAAIDLEALVLLIFSRMCPVTIVARKYSNSDRANFDIYLPEWLAKYNKEIYSVIVVVGLVVLALRLVS